MNKSYCSSLNNIIYFAGEGTLYVEEMDYQADLAAMDGME